MPRGEEKKSARMPTNMDTKVLVLKKKVPYVEKPKTVPGVHSSVTYNEETGDVSVLRFPKGFGKAVRVARENASLTQKDLATKISKPITTLADIEKENAMYDVKIVEKIEKALGVTFDPKFKIAQKG